MLVMLTLSTVVIGASPAPADEVDMRCGAYCLYISLKALDLPVRSYADVEAKLGPPSPSGYSLGQLSDVAQQYGASRLGVVTTPNNLARRRNPFACIARLGKNHFVNIGAVADGKAMIIDAPRKYELPLDTLRADWDGTALLLSTGPLVPEEELAARGWGFPGALGVFSLAVLGTVFVLYRRRGGKRS